jgi:hypothetical protein
MKTANRWVIAIAGVFLQIALGAVYAWSVFRIPLSKQFGWSISEVTFTFTISIFVLGFRGVLRRLVDGAERSANCSFDRGGALWPGRLSGELFGEQALVAVS